MLAAAHQLFARADLPSATRLRLLDLLEHTVQETTAGELEDVGLSDAVVTPDLPSVLAMTSRKTASYTFRLPLRAAVILAGGSTSLEETMSTAGGRLGLAYQLQDDLLSTFGDSARHGKDPYSDLREGKQTAIICFARMTSAWPAIEDGFGDPGLTDRRAEEIRERLRDCGAERLAAGLRFKERPFLDSLTSSTHFVSPAVVGLLLGGATIDAPLLLLLTAFFLWGMAAHAFGAVQDIVPDREAGIRSIATTIGARPTVLLALGLWTAAGVLMLFTPWPGPLAALIAVPYIVNAAPYWSATDATSSRTNRAWRRFIALNFFSGFLTTLLLIIEWNNS